MVFKRKYPESYYRDCGILGDFKIIGNETELWLKFHSMNEKEKQQLVSNYKRKLESRKYFNREQIELKNNVFLVDYTSISCVPLHYKKNRYLLNDNGYFVFGFLGAKNVLTGQKYALFVSGTQIKSKGEKSDLNEFKRLLEKELGFKVTLVLDNKHTHNYVTVKKNSMLIEVEFGGLKTWIYKRLQKVQKFVKIGKATKVKTDISFKHLMEIYLYRLATCEIKLLDAPRINRITKTDLISMETLRRIEKSIAKTTQFILPNTEEEKPKKRHHNQKPVYQKLAYLF